MAETDCEQTEILMKECFSVPWSVDALKEMFHTKGYCSFLAKEETEVIGYIRMGTCAVMQECIISWVNAISPMLPYFPLTGRKELPESCCSSYQTRRDSREFIVYILKCGILMQRRLLCINMPDLKKSEKERIIMNIHRKMPGLCYGNLKNTNSY